MSGKSRKSKFRTLAFYSSAGFNLAVSILIGAFIGYKADQYFETAPWFMIVGIVLGTAAGYLSIYETLKEEEKEEDDNGE